MEQKVRSFLAGILISFLMLTTQADIAFSGSVSQSIAFSAERSENSRAYFLDIHIEGIAPNMLAVKARGQKLILDIKQGNFTGNAIAGGQLIHYSFSYADDANFLKLSRLNGKNTVKITIPKHKY